IEILSPYLVKRCGLTNTVCEFVCEGVVQASRENVVTRCSSNATTSAMEKGEVLSMAIHVSEQQIKEGRSNKEFSFRRRIVRGIENASDRVNIESPAWSPSTLVLKR